MPPILVACRPCHSSRWCRPGGQDIARFRGAQAPIPERTPKKAVAARLPLPIPVDPCPNGTDLRDKPAHFLYMLFTPVPGFPFEGQTPILLVALQCQIHDAHLFMVHFHQIISRRFVRETPPLMARRDSVSVLADPVLASSFCLSTIFG